MFKENLERKVTKKGGTVMGVRYDSERLALWVNRNTKAFVDMRWHPRGMARLRHALASNGSISSLLTR